MNYFPSIVGQEKAKSRLGFYLEKHPKSQFVPNLLFIAPKGCGKTMIAKAFAKNLASRENVGSPKDYVEINCAQIQNVKHFFYSVIDKLVKDKEVTILFDEASELPKDVQMALLSILNPNQERSNTFVFEDFTFDFNFCRQTFLFATTEAQDLNHALVDRLVRVDLEPYSLSNLAAILASKLTGVTFEDGVLNQISSVLRGNGRQAQLMANDIASMLEAKGAKNFTLADWDKMKSLLGINPLGLNDIEIQILNVLNARGSCSLTHLSAVTGLTRECLQKDFELYIQKLGLMEIRTVKGRTLSPKGRAYIKALNV